MTERPIRIMYIISRLNIGSPAMHVTLLTERMAAAGYETLLVAGLHDPNGGDMDYFARAHGITPVYMPHVGQSLNPFTNLRAIYDLYQLMRQHNPDIVHTHLALAGFVGRMAARLAGVPVIVHTFHTHTFREHFNPASIQIFMIMERLTTSFTDAIITLTQNLRHDLVDVYRIAGKGRVSTLPLGLDLSLFANTPRHQGHFRQQWNIPAEAPLIGIVGRLVHVKNHALFLRAAALVHEQLPACRFVIVGDGETRRDVEAQIAALGLQDVVLLTGWQNDLTALYSDLDLLVNSSITEGTPTPVMEALTAGCPVVATAVGGVPDMLDHGRLGMLVFSDDAGSLADAMLLALRDPQTAPQAREIMLNRYGIDRLITDLDSLYHGLLTKKGRSSR